MPERRDRLDTLRHSPYCTRTEQHDEEREVDMLDAHADTPDGLALLAAHKTLLTLVVGHRRHLSLPRLTDHRSAQHTVQPI